MFGRLPRPIDVDPTKRYPGDFVVAIILTTILGAACAGAISLTRYLLFYDLLAFQYDWLPGKVVSGMPLFLRATYLGALLALVYAIVFALHAWWWTNGRLPRAATFWFMRRMVLWVTISYLVCFAIFWLYAKLDPGRFSQLTALPGTSTLIQLDGRAIPPVILPAAVGDYYAMFGPMIAVLALVVENARKIHGYWRDVRTMTRWRSEFAESPHKPRCAKCNYLCRGISGGACPECGADLCQIGVRGIAPFLRRERELRD